MQRFVNEGSKRPIVWEIWVDDEEVHQRSGVLDGKLKHTWDRPGPAGKEGTKAYKPADVRALERANKKITDKTRKGYREVDLETGEFLELASREMEFFEIQRNFRYGKPLGKQPKAQKEIYKLIETGDPIITVKRDGLCHFVLVTPDRNIRLYTRRLDECTDSYPHLIEDFHKLKLPPKTIGAFELVCENPLTKRDDRKMIQKLSRSLPDRAVRLQEDPLYRPRAVMLGFPFWDGFALMKEATVTQWLEALNSEILMRAKGTRYIRLMKVVKGSFEFAKQWAIERGLEGLVIYDGDAIFGDKAFNFRGRVERTASYKWKPIFEDDFVMIFNPKGEISAEGLPGGGYGKGRLMELPGQIALYQWDMDGGDPLAEMHFICNVGSGFTDAQRKDILVRARNKGGIVGVGVIKYTSRTFKSDGEDTNALSEPIFLHFHPDKTFDEAVEPKLKASSP